MKRHRTTIKLLSTCAAAVLALAVWASDALAGDDRYCAAVVQEVASSNPVSGGSWHCDDTPAGAFDSAAASDEANRVQGGFCQGNCLKPIVVRPSNDTPQESYFAQARSISGFLQAHTGVRATDAQATLTYLRDTMEPEVKRLQSEAKAQKERNESKKAELKTRLAAGTDAEFQKLVNSEDALRDLNATIAAHLEELTPLKEAFRNLFDVHVGYKSSETQLADEIATVLKDAQMEGAGSHEVAALAVALNDIYTVQSVKANRVARQAEDVRIPALRLSRELHEQFQRTLRRPMHEDTRAALGQRLDGFADAAARIAERSSRIANYATHRMRWVSDAVEQARQDIDRRAALLRQVEIAADADNFLAETERASASAAFAERVQELIDRYTAPRPVSTSTNLHYLAPRYAAACDIVEMGRVCDNLSQVAKGWMETGCNFLAVRRGSAESDVATGALRMVRLSVMLLPRRVAGQEQVLANVSGLVEAGSTEQALVLHDMVLRAADVRSTGQE